MDVAAKIIWISDLHLTVRGVVEGAPCRARLDQMVAQINRWHPDAACCIATGDLTDTGSAAEYDALAEALDALSLPFLPMIGNHDNRARLLARFPPPGPALPGFVQYRWQVGDTVLLCLDTQNPGKDSGHLDRTRLDWLRAELSALNGKRALVFMHHPPGALGLGPLDDMALVDPAPLMEILSAAPQVAQLFCGHVHRQVCGTIQGVPFTSLRSTSHQTRPPHQGWGWDDFVARQETPQYGVILVGGDRVLVQTLDLEETR